MRIGCDPLPGEFIFCACRRRSIVLTMQSPGHLVLM